MIHSFSSSQGGSPASPPDRTVRLVAGSFLITGRRLVILIGLRTTGLRLMRRAGLRVIGLRTTLGRGLGFCKGFAALALRVIFAATLRVGVRTGVGFGAFVGRAVGLVVGCVVGCGAIVGCG